MSAVINEDSKLKKQRPDTKADNALEASVLAMQRFAPADHHKKVRQKWYTTFRSISKEFVEREVFDCKWSTSCNVRGRRGSPPLLEKTANKSHLETSCVYRNREVPTYAFCKTLDAHQDTVNVLKLNVSVEFDSLYRGFANDSVYIKKVQVSYPELDVALPPSLFPEKTHFTMCDFEVDECESGTGTPISGVPLAWPLSSQFLHDDSDTDFYDNEFTTTPFDALVAFLGYLMTRRDDSEFLNTTGVRIEDVVESIGLLSRVRVTLSDATVKISLGELFVHKNLDPKHDAVQGNAFSSAPKSLGKVHAASFVHAYNDVQGVPMLMDLVLWNEHQQDIFRTSCIPLDTQGNGLVKTRSLISYPRLRHLNRMYVAGDDADKRKAEDVAHALFASGDDRESRRRLELEHSVRYAHESNSDSESDSQELQRRIALERAIYGSESDDAESEDDRPL
eukprot:gene313-572_t